MASLADISRRAGTSVATASRVLNGSTHPVSEPTRARVLEAAADLGYAPSALAQALVPRSSRIIGVIVNDIVDPYFAEIARGVEDVAGRMGYLVMVCNADHRVEAEIEYVQGTARLPRRGARVRRGSGAASAGPVNERLRARTSRRRAARGARVVALARREFPGAARRRRQRGAPRYDVTELPDLARPPPDRASSRGRRSCYTSAERLAGLRAPRWPPPD